MTPYKINRIDKLSNTIYAVGEYPQYNNILIMTSDHAPLIFVAPPLNT